MMPIYITSAYPDLAVLGGALVIAGFVGGCAVLAADWVYRKYKERGGRDG